MYNKKTFNTINKDEFLEQALKANEEAASKATLADLSNKDSSVYSGLNVPPKEKVSSIPEKPKFDAEGLPIIPQIRTFSGDINDAVKEKSLSATKIISKESSKPVENKAKKPVGTYIASSLLIFLSVGIVGYGYYMFFIKENPTQTVFIEPEKEVIFSEQKVSIDLKNATLNSYKESFDNEIKKVENDGFKKIELFIADKKIPTNEFLVFLQARAPEELFRSLYDKYYLGIHYLKDVKTPVLMLFTTNSEIALPSMLEWEDTLAYDLRTIFGFPEGETFITPTFSDLLLENRDVRIVGAEGNVLFFYTIIDNNIILFTKDKETLREILRRLRENKITK